MPDARAPLQAGCATWDAASAVASAYPVATLAEYGCVGDACVTAAGQVLIAAANGQVYAWAVGQATIDAALAATAVSVAAVAADGGDATDADAAAAASAAAAAVVAEKLPAPQPVLCVAALHVKRLVPSAATTYVVDDLGDVYRTDLVASLERIALPDGDACLQLSACGESKTLVALGASGRVYTVRRVKWCQVVAVAFFVYQTHLVPSTFLLLYLFCISIPVGRQWCRRVLCRRRRRARA